MAEPVTPTQWLVADLYQVSVPTINQHVANTFDEQALDPSPTIRKFRMVQTVGNREVSRLVDHYNLDVFLAIGYRVRSHWGTQFRRRATAAKHLESTKPGKGERS